MTVAFKNVQKKNHLIHMAQQRTESQPCVGSDSKLLREKIQAK